MANAFILLDDLAVDVLHEITKNDDSYHPVARAIVDGKFGEASLKTTRPQSEVEERILCIDSDAPHKTINTIILVPGVTAASRNYRTLVDLHPC